MLVRVEEIKEIKNRGRGREKRKEHLFPQLLFVLKLHDCFLIGIKLRETRCFLYCNELM